MSSIDGIWKPGLPLSGGDELFFFPDSGKKTKFELEWGVKPFEFIEFE